MDVSLQVYNFQNISNNSNEPSTVDFETVGLDENGNNNNNNQPVIKLYNDYEKVSDGFEATVYTTIYIPTYILTDDVNTKNTYQSFESNSTFFTNHNFIDEVMLSEFALSHFNVCSAFIFHYTSRNFRNEYMLDTPSLSKLILLAESGGHSNKNKD